ncbi:MAG: class I SAM-dependent methyltransferase [Microthrixaceae bacterium]
MHRPDTTDPAYAERLAASVAPRHGWRAVVDPQRPYRWNIRRLGLGRVLDIGCGVGRNLSHLDGNGVGVDHNADSVRIARARGLGRTRRTSSPARSDDRPGSFDSLLFAHVLEHMTPPEATGTGPVVPAVPAARRTGRGDLPARTRAGVGRHPRHLPRRRGDHRTAARHRCHGRTHHVVPVATRRRPGVHPQRDGRGGPVGGAYARGPTVMVCRGQGANDVSQEAATLGRDGHAAGSPGARTGHGARPVRPDGAHQSEPIDVFAGEWTSTLPAEADVQAGAVPLFADPRITWLIDHVGGVDGFRVLELGPLEGGHSAMLHQAGASVVAIESNTRGT